MTIRRLAVLGGLFILIGAGCQTGTTQEEVSDTSSSTETEAFSDTEASEEETMELAHPGILPDEQIKNKQIRITTDKGDIVFELFADTAPLAVSNFVFLTEQGYYDGLTFHRVEPGFVIQGGDLRERVAVVLGYRFEDELGTDHIPEDLLTRMEEDPAKSLYMKGIVAMANAGPNTNGSQFFIMLDSIPSANMPNLYSIFGEVLEGQDVVDSIEVGDVMTKVAIEDIEEVK